MEKKYVICKNIGVCAEDSVYSGNTVVREAISAEEMNELIDRIAYTQTIHAPNDKVRREFYTLAMEKYDALEWVKVIKSVYLRAEDGRLMSGEGEIGELAKKYLHGEISAVLGIPFEKVEEYITDRIESDTW